MERQVNVDTMKTRMLKAKDATLMLEWMHDPSVVEYMYADFAHKTLEDCIQFIDDAQDTSEFYHLAVVDDQDEYMGTVSLKHIHDGEAEFAITMRKEAMGKGYAAFGMKDILQEGKKMGLQTIFWCVPKANTRAVRFYDKNGYSRVEYQPNFNKWGGYTPEQIKQLYWYEA